MARSYWVSRFKHQGATTTELGLALCLVAGIAVLSLTMLGHSISDLLGKASNANTASSSSLSLLAPKYNNTGGKSGSQIPFTTSQGTSITVDAALQNNLGKTVLTTGVNGATNMLSDTIRSIADQLKASGEIDASQYSALVGLANEGHNLASTEAKFQNIVAASSNSSDLGQFMSQNPDLSATGNQSGWYVLGFTHGGAPNPLQIADPMDASVALPATKQFLDAYNTVLDSGALGDPKVKSIIDAMTSDISYMSQLVGATTGQVSYGDITPDQQLATIASQLTHQDSGGICTVGSGTDSGTQCSATPTN